MATILIVDDKKNLANLLKQHFEIRGHTAVAAYSADEALKKIDTHAFDLVISDYSMPGKNGVALAKEIGQKTKNQFLLLFILGMGKLALGLQIRIMDR